jgi:hypothetical protein
MDFYAEIAKSRQIEKRLRELLPFIISRLQLEYRNKGFSATKSTRLAHLDPRYLDHINKLSEASFITLELKIARDHHLCNSILKKL